jgi:hypothetical protein
MKSENFDPPMTHHFAESRIVSDRPGGRKIEEWLITGEDERLIEDPSAPLLGHARLPHPQYVVLIFDEDLFIN